MLMSFLATVDQGQRFPIPNVSPLQPIARFEVRHLQTAGLINHRDTCCHLSVVLCLHRMGILKFLREDLIANGANVFDMPALVLSRMLRALPSPIPFSVQNFLTSWNRDRRLPVLQSNDDLMIVDGILSQLPLAAQAAGSNVPVMTRFLASYACNYCGRVDQSCEKWDERNFVLIPKLHMAQGNPVTAEDLLEEMLQQQMMITCPNGQCRGRVMATWRTVMGAYTVLHIDRANLQGGINNTRLLPRDQASVPHNVLGELVSVVSRSGSGHNRGHFVSYHQVGGTWFFNNDDHAHFACNFHPFNRRDGNECVSLLCYYNI